MISTREELHHLIDCLSASECERALARLELFRQPHCPSCEETDLANLAWHEDETHVTRESCGFTWEPNRELIYGG